MIDQIPHLESTYPELNIPLDGRYQVIEILAAKAWARAYLAQDLHRPSKPECVIRQLKPIPAVPNYTQTVEGLFAGEAAALEHLGTHPQIPQLLACFQDSNGFYTVHEWIDGVFLKDELDKRKRWSTEAVMHLLQSVLAPLAFAHQSGSVHGHLQPSHLLRRLQDGQWTLIDFSGMQEIQLALSTIYGVATIPENISQLVYQPPEQLQGLCCPANDVYALGMIAIQALTGLEPGKFCVDPQTDELIWQKHILLDGSSLQNQLIAVLDGMVQRDITKRFATAHEVQMALENIALEDLLQSQMPTLLVPTISATLSEGPKMMAENRFQTNDIDLPEKLKAVSVNSFIVSVSGDAIANNLLTPDSEKHAITTNTSSETSSHDRAPEHPELETFISPPSLQISVGGIAVAATFAAVGWGLLNSVDWSAPTQVRGENPQPSEKSNASTASDSGNLLQRWRTQWQQGMTNYQKAEQAFSQKRWADVSQLASDIPNVPYWHAQGKQLARKAIALAEPESFQMLQSAYQSAQERNFTQALGKLNQIVPGTSVEAIAQTKLTEYREKQNIKAWADLQKAYDHASVRDFTQALAYLYQVPEGTTAYATAQQKILEYKEKNQIRTQTLMQAVETF